MKGTIQNIMAILGPLYPDRTPFLDYKTPFQLLVATVLSAQCTDAAVNAITPELFRLFPDPAAMAKAPLADLERLVYSTGTFRAKAHNIRSLSRMIIERHGGEVPDTMEKLTTLPGVGRKTAGTVIANIYQQPAIIVDTHFTRVSRRLGLTRSDKPIEIEKDIAWAAPKEEWTDISNVLNRFGRAACHARKPKCDGCPVKEYCSGP